MSTHESDSESVHPIILTDMLEMKNFSMSQAITYVTKVIISRKQYKIP